MISEEELLKLKGAELKILKIQDGWCWFQNQETGKKYIAFLQENVDDTSGSP